ncbi:MAG: VCBS repeat-containing protein [Deltaproteobacteria bacterium]|jgi:hypothetical protein|nr:VCBS repeat-containing protein [Deltaproteobacteria bacterium]
MSNTFKIALLWTISLSLFIVSASIADDQKKLRHPSYSLLGYNPPADSPLNPNFIIAQEAKMAHGALWNGGYISERLVGLDVGDATGDRSNDLVYASLNNVYLARRVGDGLEQLANFNVPPSLRILSIDFFDINGNGVNEILVSCQKNGAGASSYILAYEPGQKTLKIVSEFVPWYLRVYGPSGQKKLAVQKSGTTTSVAYSGDVLSASVSQEGKVVTSGRLPLPFGVNLYNFNIGRIGPQGQDFIAAVTFPDEHLKLFSGPSRDEIVGESPDEYCGTINYINMTTSPENGRDLEYLPSRILFADIDSDGANEVIVAKNKQGGIPFMKNLRAFNGGIIEGMKFANLSLTPFFSSANLLPGPAVDYQLADLDNNGTKDLVVGVVIAPGSGMMETGRSVIVSYSNLYSRDTQSPAPTQEAKKVPKK